ncbi:hypothetical protein KSP40_PGU003791 [Platanthera guangdongensis]|uniref:Uncharacterized protein n=1 Tax=Platanthera guangdongensis TaxID=2320717 RepID=A0ABR2M870_9ASPA
MPRQPDHHQVVVARPRHQEGDLEWRIENEGELHLSLDLVEELYNLVTIWKEEVKWRMARYFDKYIRVKKFIEGDLVLKKVDVVGSSTAVGKLNPNWVVPYIVEGSLKLEGYHLQNIEGCP